jgi:hypothetical protein
MEAWINLVYGESRHAAFLIAPSVWWEFLRAPFTY